MSKQTYTVYAEYSIRRKIGVYVADSEEEALKLADEKVWQKPYERAVLHTPDRIVAEQDASVSNTVVSDMVVKMRKFRIDDMMSVDAFESFVVEAKDSWDAKREADKYIEKNGIFTTGYYVVELK